MKIALIGHPGSGKTYLSNKLSEKTGIHTINLDSLFDKHPEYLIMTKNYQVAASKLFDGHINWIVNGYHGKRMLESIWEEADIIIFIDLEKKQLKKNIKQRQKTVKKNGEFSHWQYSKLNNLKNYSQIKFRDNSLRSNFERIKKMRSDVEVVILKSMDEVNNYIENFVP
jgi:adenylate kinase family enzyme